jgi:hypothetical protein
MFLLNVFFLEFRGSDGLESLMELEPVKEVIIVGLKL